MLLKDLKIKRKNIKERYNLEKSKVNNLQQIMNGLNKNISELEKDNEILKTNLKTILDEVDARDKIINNFENLQEAYNIIKEKENEYIKKITDLENNNNVKNLQEEYKSSVEYYENMLDIYEKEYLSLKGKNTALEKNYNDYNDEIDMYKTTISESEKVVNNLNMQVEDLMSKLNSISKNQEIEKDINLNKIYDYKNEITQKDTVITLLKNEIEFMKNDSEKNIELEKKLNSLKKKNEELKKDSESININLVKYKNENAWLLQEVDTLFNLKEKGDYKINCYSENEKVLNNKLQKLTNKITELENENNDLKNENNELNTLQDDNMSVIDDLYELDEKYKVISNTNTFLVEKLKQIEEKENHIKERENAAIIIQSSIRAHQLRNELQNIDINEFENIEITDAPKNENSWYNWI